MNTSQIIIIILLIFLLVLSAILIAISSKLYIINNIKKGGMVPIDRMKEFLRNNDFDENDAEAFCTYLSNELGTNTLTEFDEMREYRAIAYQNWKRTAKGSYSSPDIKNEVNIITRQHIGKFKHDNNIIISSSEMDNFRNYLNGDGSYLSGDFVHSLNNGENGKCLEIYDAFKNRDMATPSGYAIMSSPSPSGYAIMPQQLIGSVSITEIMKFFKEAGINDADADSFLKYVNNSGFVESNIDFINIGFDQRMQLYQNWKEESKSSSTGYAIMPPQQAYNSRGEIINENIDLSGLDIDELEELFESAKNRIKKNNYTNIYLPNPITREDDEYLIKKIPEVLSEKYYGNDRGV